jgi:hypothetical protein
MAELISSVGQNNSSSGSDAMCCINVLGLFLSPLGSYGGHREQIKVMRFARQFKYTNSNDRSRVLEVPVI